MRKLLVANWKENPKTETDALRLFKDTVRTKRKDLEVVICAPFIYLGEVAAAFEKMNSVAKKNLALGAQDVFWEDLGAFTSEVGPKMIKSLGVRYVIIGHSERRKYLKETDAMINKKIKLAQKDGLNVILCVGEPLAIRKKGIAVAKNFIKNQVKNDLMGIHGGKKTKGSLTIAYEPIWAIGTGKNDSPEDALEMAAFIKDGVQKFHNMKIRFLYGGSANSKNIRDFVQYKSIDGALVGGASLKEKEFGKMIARVGGQKK